MKELLSRMLLSTEAIVVTLPVTAFLATQKLPALWRRMAEHPGPESSLMLAACVVLLAYAGCLWRLTVAFSMHGSAALVRLFVPFWYVPHAVLTIAAGVLAFVSAAFVIETSWMRAFALALPLAIPSLHLGLECLLRPDAHVGAGSATTGGRAVRTRVLLKLVR